jgi:hypothetical protein
MTEREQPERNRPLGLPPADEDSSSLGFADSEYVGGSVVEKR